MKNCSICNLNESKYKCPICLVYYCSVACCKKHRMDKCEVATTPQLTIQSVIKNTEEILFPTSSTVDIAKLEELRNIKELRNLLSNPHLRALLIQVNNAPNAKNVMAKAMHEQIFVEFANACLDVVNNEKQENNIEIVD